MNEKCTQEYLLQENKTPLCAALSNLAYKLEDIRIFADSHGWENSIDIIDGKISIQIHLKDKKE